MLGRIVLLGFRVYGLGFAWVIPQEGTLNLQKPPLSRRQSSAFPVGLKPYTLNPEIPGSGSVSSKSYPAQCVELL